MTESDWLAERFEEHRERLRAMAQRMLGSAEDANDAVQIAWLRLSGADAGRIENMAGWLTTVVGRVCVDMLRLRRTRNERPFDVLLPETIASHEDSDPESRVLSADAVGVALLVVLDTLAPAERLAFVLHDIFAVPFDEIAPIVGRSPVAARQLASRARRRVQGVPLPERDLTTQRTLVDAFLAASREGDFNALLALLDPDVILHSDEPAPLLGAAREVRGARAVAETFSGRAQAARAALVNGAVGAVWAIGGRPRVAFDFVIAAGRIIEIEMIASEARLRDLDLVSLD